MRLTFCQFSGDGRDRRPVEIDPMAVTRLVPGVRELVHGKFVEAVLVLTVVLADGSEYTVFDTLGTVAKRIIAERAVEMGRAASVTGNGPSPV
jgi:hypothetical protein